VQNKNFSEKLSFWCKIAISWFVIEFSLIVCDCIVHYGVDDLLYQMQHMLPIILSSDPPPFEKEKPEPSRSSQHTKEPKESNKILPISPRLRPSTDPLQVLSGFDSFQPLLGV